jgi:hypothetical protein
LEIRQGTVGQLECRQEGACFEKLKEYSIQMGIEVRCPIDGDVVELESVGVYEPWITASNQQSSCEMGEGCK